MQLNILIALQGSLICPNELRLHGEAFEDFKLFSTRNLHSLACCRLEASLLKVGGIALRLEAIAVRLEAIACRLEAVAVWLEAIAGRLEAIAVRLEVIAIN